MKSSILLTNWFAVIFAVILFSAKPLSAQINFTWSGNCINNPIQFTPTGVSIPSIATWYWQFGDGDISTMSNPVHTYAAPGYYNVTLSVVNTSGIPSSVSHTVSANPLPTAFFAYDTLACIGNSVNFIDLSFSNSGYIVQWIWSFGDGAASDTITFPNYQYVSHLYLQAGTYWVTLTVKNSGSCENSFTSAVTIHNAPVADFFVSGICQEQVVQFTDASTINGSGSIASWDWNFGDPNSGINNTSVLQNPYHLFSNPGVYPVSQVVTNFFGCSDTMIKMVVIHEKPPVDFTYSGGCLMNPTLFTPVVNPASIANYLWDFGDGATSASNSAYHIYIAPGIYNVSLTVTDTLGCINFITKPVTIHPLPTVHFTFSTPQLNQAVQFTDQSVSNSPVIQWEWSFGDGNMATVQNPSHSYTIPGNYTVSLVITDVNGCSGTTDSILIVPSGASNITLTGKVFAGSNTINDAVVRLIMIDSSGMPVSELKTFPGTNNEFVFQNIPEGNYYLHAYPFVNSPVAPSFLPTFYINSVFWQTATLINLGQAQNPYDIHLANYSILIGGTFVINGQLVNNGKSINTAEQEVLLLDNQNNPIRWTITDNNGGFSFDSLPAGTYSVNPVLAGLTTYPFYVVLNQNTSPVFVKMIISDQTITAIQKPVAAPGRCKVFPNPTSESITISCDEVMKKIIISNSLGEILLEVNPATAMYQADVSSFPSGIYFIKVITSNEEFKIKAVVTH
ncbi:MAG: PKD domain-containing protein [Bacteroidota bacterium]